MTKATTPILAVLLLVLASPIAAESEGGVQGDGSTKQENDVAGDSYGDKPANNPNYDPKDPYANPYGGHQLPGTSYPDPLDVGPIAPEIPNVVVNFADYLLCVAGEVFLGASPSEAEEICSGG